LINIFKIIETRTEESLKKTESNISNCSASFETSLRGGRKRGGEVEGVFCSDSTVSLPVKTAALPKLKGKENKIKKDKRKIVWGEDLLILC